MTEQLRIHPETGQRLTRGTRPMTIAWGALSRTLDVAGWYPEGEGDAIHSGADLAELDAAQAELRTEYARSVKSVRKSLKLSQEAAGRILGGGKRAFQKYESGRMAPSDSAVAVIELVRRDPSAIETLKKLPGRQAAG